LSPAARLQAILELMQQIASEALPADAVISRWFRTRRDLADVDRAQILDLVYDVLRHHARLNWWLDRVVSPNTHSHRLFAWLVLDGTPSKRVDGLFAQAQGMSLLKSERTALPTTWQSYRSSRHARQNAP
jgi:16S rRNA (cytosine967-C5)-methyltransferase